MKVNSVSFVVLLLLALTVRRGSSDGHDRQSLEWCSKFPDEEAREQCKNSVGNFWTYSPTCCNVKFECLDGEYNQGLRCSVPGHVPDRNSMKCVEDANCIDDTTTEDPTTTTTTRTTTTHAPATTLSTTTVSVPSSSYFCDSFPTNEPPIYCAESIGSFWMSSPSCCNVKFECLDGAYNQGFRCSTPGFIPDISQLKCIEDSRCVRDTESTPDVDSEPPEMICCNAVSEYLPHPSDCSRYIRCVEGVMTLLECMAGSIFQYQFQQCLPGDKVTCLPLGV